MDVILSKIWIVFVGIAFIFGIPVGYYLYPHAPVGTIPSSLIQYTPIVGMAIVILKIINDFRKENVLEFGDVHKKLEYRDGVNETGFYIRIIKKKGKGRAENCEGLITLQEPDGKKLDIPARWDDADDSKYTNISIQDDLKLFHLSDNEQSLFLFPHHGLKYYERLTSKALDSTISVTLGSSSGTVPKKPFVMTIRNIISNAKDTSPDMFNV